MGVVNEEMIGVAHSSFLDESSDLSFFFSGEILSSKVPRSCL